MEAPQKLWGLVRWASGVDVLPVLSRFHTLMNKDRLFSQARRHLVVDDRVISRKLYGA